MKRFYPLFALAIITLPKGWEDSLAAYVAWLYQQGLYDTYLYFMTVCGGKF